MRYHALVCDYDGTIARDGRVDDATGHALLRVKGSGRRLILVTGRELPDLLDILEAPELFDRIVAENGALLYDPSTREERPLADPPPSRFLDELRARGVHPLSAGRVIVATWHPNEDVVLATVRDLGLELQVIFNKGAVMVLPSGVNKATGLAAACEDLGLSLHNVAGVGDAENDHAFLSSAEFSAAVGNALASLKDEVDFVTRESYGAGVAELVEVLLDDDLAGIGRGLQRHRILLGHDDDGSGISVDPHGHSMLVAGASGSGKSTFVVGFVERLADAGYQFCLVDPEGDYESWEGAVVVGDSAREPTVDEVLGVLEAPGRNAMVNLLGLPLGERPRFFESLFPRLQELRARVGRPHWVVVDEAHHLLPTTWDPSTLQIPGDARGLLLVTVHPDAVSPVILRNVDAVIAVGPHPMGTFSSFATAAGRAAPADVGATEGPCVLWTAGDESARRFVPEPGTADRRRHRRKYAEGELGEDASFYFTGPDGRLNLRAQNLVLFTQIAEGVDDETWTYHLRRGDYSQWFRDTIKDDGLADEAEAVEADESLAAAESRRRIAGAVEERYTLPAR